MATQQLEQVLDRLMAVEEPPRALDETHLDPIGDLWTIPLWSATADLFGCRYFQREEGGCDSAGRMRMTQIRHCVIGPVADQIATKVMAEHFCATIRRLARIYARQLRAGAAVRRSFEAGCAARVTQRLSFVPGEVDARGRARTTAFVVSIKRRGRRSNAEIAAEHAGADAADDISLVVRNAAPTRSGRVAPDGTQMGFAF